MARDEKAAALSRVAKTRRALMRATERLTDCRADQGEAAAAAVALGATYDEVGDALGVSRQRAFDIVKAHEQREEVPA